MKDDLHVLVLFVWGFVQYGELMLWWVVLGVRLRVDVEGGEVIFGGLGGKYLELLRDRMKLALDVLLFVWKFFQIPQEARGGVGVGLRMVLGDEGVMFGVLEQRMADMVVGGSGAEVDVCGSGSLGEALGVGARMELEYGYFTFGELEQCIVDIVFSGESCLRSRFEGWHLSADALVCWIGSGFYQIKKKIVRLKLIATEALVFMDEVGMLAKRIEWMCGSVGLGLFSSDAGLVLLEKRICVMDGTE
ncbi:hypothetical protein EMWEY_00007530 [Eimeria maxima]|uniref:Uncharacterized protein n=1 Tax=Eimeria maxima TaxID=5804 RepID=U6M9I7_EIMMA|nr:hypothetical protein EMWEY_00007530 [Eimeria maxima]CDJ60681.1 hypothetical protein EMWEY_00007530 [Eimeria maxima]